MGARSRKAAVIVGVGPGLGASLARRFAAGGYVPALVARTRDNLEAIAADIDGAVPFALDGTDSDAVVGLFDRVESEIGPVEVAVYNASGRVKKSILDLAGKEFELAWRQGCFGGFLTGREAGRRMAPRGRGTILFTGATASLKGYAESAAFAAGKFGLRAVAQSMARELHPKGIHVAHFVIDGQIGESRDGTKLHPDMISESYFAVHEQDRSAWTHEVELRPWKETF
ncbi:MAG: SDR family NAD(P)-dependent oxidoreductase [Acetobacterales bacterium]